MIISQISQGLGNQLFQYAMGRRLADRRRSVLKLDLRWFSGAREVPGLEAFSRRYKLDHFETTAAIASAEEIARLSPRPLRRYDPRRLRGPWWRLLRRYPMLCYGMHIEEKGMNFEPALLSLPGDVYLAGWWQSENYFRDAADEIRREFRFKDRRIWEQAREDAVRFKASSSQLVAVHVRRGDVARAHEVLRDLTFMPYELVTLTYLREAMSRFGQDAIFLVFSDTAEDVDWCRLHLATPNCRFISGRSDLEDFALMSSCDHNIISNSSFGWWAAWLNPRPWKQVVAPKAWFRKEYAPSHDIHSLIPAEWTVL